MAYHEWITKLELIFSMFYQVRGIMPSQAVELYNDPEKVGNKACYMFLVANVDQHFQRVIRQYEGYRDKALQLLQVQCSSVTANDRHYFHRIFSALFVHERE